MRLYDAAKRLPVGIYFTEPGGGFLAPRLAPGSYLVTAGLLGYEHLAFDGVPFADGQEGPALLVATPVAVPENGRFELRPLRLRRLGDLSGRIVDAESGAPIAGARILAFPGDLQLRSGLAYSEEDGSFKVAGLVPGTHYLVIDGPGMRDLLVGGDQACTAREDGYSQFAACDPTRGTPFTVVYAGDTGAGEIRLPREGRIRGSMRLASGRAEWQQIQIYNSGNRLLMSFTPPGEVNEWGIDLPVPGGGTYFLVGLASEHLAQVYDHVDCAVPGQSECVDFTEGTPVMVPPGGSREGVDFDLRLDQRSCASSPTTLCLNGGRFSVRGWHAGPNGNIGGIANAAARITEEAGYFTFFDPDNVELVVKVLDACESFGAFWIFTAGLTDVGNVLQVRDHWAAETRRYNTFGYEPYQPFIDSTSFRACDLLPPSAEPAAAESAGEMRQAAAASLAAPQPAPGLVPNGCGSDPGSSLCLGDRFAVEAEWTTALGETGSAVPRPLTADTGFFYFFSPNNIEVVVKVLDACRPDLGNRYWVFAAGMTDVAVTLKVTDTATGEEKIYLSPLGGLFQPILDLTGFAGCP